VIASEVKTATTYKKNNIWYLRSRGVQVLSALYHFNNPTFLINQKQWKIFVENKERNMVMTYPFGSDPQADLHENASKTRKVGPQFVMAIVICILSRTSDSVRSSEVVADIVEINENGPQNDTPQRNIQPPSSDSGEEKPPKLPKCGDSAGVKKPGFFVDVGGQPVFMEINVRAPEIIAKAEEIMATMDL
jgi:hypothetical protein